MDNEAQPEAQTLSEFLYARYAEDKFKADGADSERIKQAVKTGQHTPLIDLLFVSQQTPARTLADIHAKRRIIEMGEALAHCTLHERDREPTCPECKACALVEGYDDVILEFLALPYTDHPDYQQKWMPRQ